MAITFLSGNSKKSRTLSEEIKLSALSELKPQNYKIKYDAMNINKSQKPRAKSILIEKEKLYEENLHLKLLSNELVEENIKLKTRIQQNENDFKRNSEKYSNKEFKGSSLMMLLKLKVKELKERNSEISLEYNRLKNSMRATRVSELEKEAKQYFNECWRLKKLLEEAVLTSNKMPKNSKNEENTQSYKEKIAQQSNIIQNLNNENKSQKQTLEMNAKEIKSLKEEINNLNNELKLLKQEQNKETNETNEKKDPIINIKESFKRGITLLKPENQERELKRELNTNTGIIVSSFFRMLH